MNSLDEELNQRLETLRQQGLYRRLRPLASPPSPRIVVAGKPLLNFSSNDYLGLACDPRLKEAAIRAVEKYGTGVGSSRLICGSLPPHEELELELARFKGAEAALSFNTGYAAAIGTITALMGKSDIIVIDKLAHACIVDAARMCGATLRVFAHNDLEDLERILRWCAEKRARQTDIERARVLIVTESVFSMDGDQAPLVEIAALKDRYDAWLMVDEAHATGLYGPNRRGVIETSGLGGHVEIQMGTLGKALGTAGGFICGSRTLIDYLINRARSFIFSTAPPPAVAASATAALRLIQTDEGARICRDLWRRVDQIKHGLERTRFAPAIRSAIMPLMVGDEHAAVEISAELLGAGILIPAIRYPTVARGAARLRLTVSAAHSPEDVEKLLHALNPVPPPPAMA